MDTLYSAVTSDSITLYWDKSEKAGTHWRYDIYVDETKVGDTDKTHFTIEALRPKQEYDIRVEASDGLTVVAVCEARISTQKEKKKLDVTAAPYHALGDGEHMNTQAIQQAIDDCGAEDMVYIPAGVFKTGALCLHSDMELYLEEGAVLLGTENPEDYLPRIRSRFEGIEMECYSSLLNMGSLDHEAGYLCENVLIHGKGTIESGGWQLARNVIDSEKERRKDYLKSLGSSIGDYESEDTIPGRVRPRLINISNCRNVRLSGLTLKNGASWNVHIIYSDQILTDGCSFYSQGIWNGDGWDPDSSTNCTLFGCNFYTGDDSVAIKSGKNPEGNVIGRPCQHIRIFDCVSAFGHGIAIGSEISGGISDIRIWDCDLSSSIYGIQIKGTPKRGGYVKNVEVRDCKVSRVLMHSVSYNDDGEAAPLPPVFEQCRFERMQITGKCLSEDGDGSYHSCPAIELKGFDIPGHEIRAVEFKNIAIGCGEGSQEIIMENCRNVTFEQIRTE